PQGGAGTAAHGGGGAALRMRQVVEAGVLFFYVRHAIADLDPDPPTAGFAAVIYGHSHQPSIETRDGVLWLNPGSAGPRRFSLPITLARVRVAGGALSPEIVTLAK